MKKDPDKKILKYMKTALIIGIGRYLDKINVSGLTR